MAEFRINARDTADIGKKPRVYFTCHPDDFDKYFKKICEDILKTHNCAIYYKENLTEAIPEDEKETDLGRHNLFVVPVTYKLLSTENLAMSEEIPYAIAHHIPVLPFMMENGIDVLYSKPDKFGKLQYLNPCSHDITEIPYAKKLKKYLETVLISDELAKRIRAAFDAYIFLSYRKKDRRYANELMKLIHSIPECRDIAIWFDEFLTPGESFADSIEKILNDSQLFTLLVTPNLLEEPDGKPNFVMAEEYPAAFRSGKEILPAEMEKTDKQKLSKKFKGINECLNPYNDAHKARMLEAIARLASRENNTPEHNFLIGIAYLEGIDVEINHERGIELITSAAEAGVSEAMEALYKIYSEGTGTTADWHKALKWAQELEAYYRKEFGEASPEALSSLNTLAVAYEQTGSYTKAQELQEKACSLMCSVLGKENKQTLMALNDLAITYYHLNRHRKALEIQEEVYAIYCRIYGNKHHETLTVLNTIAGIHRSLGNRVKALELLEKAYELSCISCGEGNTTFLAITNNLAVVYMDLGRHQKASELLNKAYTLFSDINGEEHPDTVLLLNNLASAYRNLKNPDKAVEIQQKAHALTCRIYGEEHPYTLQTLNNLIIIYIKLKRHRKALPLLEKAHALTCRIYGEEHPYTALSMYHLACCCSEICDYTNALTYLEKAYFLRRKILGDTHTDTVNTLNELIKLCRLLRLYQKAAIFEKLSESTQKKKPKKNRKKR